MVGLGGIGQRHVRNLRHMLQDQVEILAYRVRRLSHVVTPSLQSDNTKKVEEEYGIRSFTNLDEALSERPDIAFVCNPSNMHVRTATVCANAGCDLFIEKPLSSSLEGLDELESAVREKERVVMVGYQLRFHPCFQALASTLQRQQVGNILGVRAIIGEFLPNWHRYEDYREMYAARADLGGGVVLSQIHELDYLYSLFGLPSRIFAMGGHWSHLEIDVEDTASILMEYVVDNRPLPVHLHEDYLQQPPRRNCEVIGDRGTIIADFVGVSVTVYGDSSASPEVQSFPQFDRNQLFLNELNHFLSCVASRSKPCVDLHDGAQSLRMALAVKESIASGLPVNVRSSSEKIAFA
jgi:predicted dehydrogenase